MLKHSLLLLLAIFLLAACGQPRAEKLEMDLDEVVDNEPQISSETINDIIQNIASPIEVATQIYALDVPFSKQYLANPESLAESATSFEMAFSLGALSADLGYLNIYEKTGTAVNFLSSVNRLAEALQLGQFFDLNTIKLLATSSSNPDTLMFILVNSFNKMNDYLRETGQGKLSALMIAGGWMEGLYLSTQAALQTSNQELKSMIGEQKLILNDLLLVLYNYQNDETIARYIDDLELIKSIYDEVKISYDVGEPEAVEKDGMLLVVQSETSRVSMRDETLHKIIEITEQIRNMYINVKT